MEKKKLSHPELFREPMLTTVFSELPELCELFDEAFSVRNAAAQLFEKGREDIGVRKDIYIRACAIYDTLLRRSRYVMAAARTTMKEILKHQRDYHSCDYEYALGECGKIAENRETAIQRRNV